MEKSKLLSIAKPHLNNENKLVFVTSDGCVFLEKDQSFGLVHANRNSLEVFEVNLADIEGVASEEAPTKKKKK